MRHITSSSRQMSVIVCVATLSLVVLMSPGISRTTDITPSGLGTEVRTPTTLPNGAINYDITGGTRPGGGPNLFHSFGEFSVATDNIANFLNETNMPTENILSRVTGGNPSNIFGTIQTTNFGAANLYLINPAGVMFGPTAELNVGGSFAASTADYLKMTDGAKFYANPAQTTVLSIAPVAAFGFLGLNPSVKITVQGDSSSPILSIAQGQSFSLIGGDISITNRIVAAPGGQFNVASVASAGEVAPSASGQPAALSLNGFTALGNISLTQGTTIDTSSNAAGPIVLRGGQLVMAGHSNIGASTGNVPGGNIDVKVGKAQISEFSGIGTGTFGSGRAGDVSLTAPTMTITDGAFVTAVSFGAGQAGAVTLQAARLNVTNGAQVVSNTFDTGQGGSVTITATEQMRLAGSNENGPSTIATITTGSGNGGQILVTTPVLDLQRAEIVADTGASGNAGSIMVEAGQLSLANGALIASRGEQDATGDAGSVTLQLAGLFSSQDSTVSSSAAQGAGGNVSITAGNMNLNSGTTISAQSAGFNDAGNIALTSATDLLMINSTVTTSAAQASGGNIKLTAPTIIWLRNSQLTSSVLESFNSPTGGNINIDPQFFILQNSLILAGSNLNPLGRSGGLTVAVSGAILVDPNSTVSVSGSVIKLALSGNLAPLIQASYSYSQAGLSGDRCAADPTGQFSSFVQAGRDGVPQVPGALAPSPLSFLETLTSGSWGSPAPNWATARLGLDSVKLDDSTRYRFHSVCRS